MTVRYSNEHEWIRVEGDVGTVGISPYAQEQLGDVVFVEVPQAGLDRRGRGVDVVAVQAEAGFEAQRIARAQPDRLDLGFR